MRREGPFIKTFCRREEKKKKGEKILTPSKEKGKKNWRLARSNSQREREKEKKKTGAYMLRGEKEKKRGRRVERACLTRGKEGRRHLRKEGSQVEKTKPRVRFSRNGGEGGGRFRQERGMAGERGVSARMRKRRKILAPCVKGRGKGGRG